MTMTMCSPPASETPSDVRCVTDFPAHLRNIASEYRCLDERGRRDEWDRLLNWSVESIMRMAVVLRMSVDAGDDVDHVKSRWPKQYGQLLAVADGRAAPEAVQRFGIRPDICRRVLAMPLERQKELAATDAVDVVERGSGEYVTRKMQLSLLPKHLVAQALPLDGTEGTFERQLAHISVGTNPRKRTLSDYKIDKRRGLLVIRHLGKDVLTLSKHQVRQILEQMESGN